MRRMMHRRSCRPAGEQLESRALMATFHVITAAAYGPGSLRVAIAQANEKPGIDAIDFNIPGEGPKFIALPFEGLPAINSKIIIDGYTQDGSARNTSADPAVNNAKIMVNLVMNGGSGPALTVNARGGFSQIRGLGFYSTGTYGPSGIGINRASFVTVDGNTFGATGQSRLAVAVNIDGGNNNTIGGDLASNPALQNVMGRYDIGVNLSGATNNNAIYGNLIGRQPVESRNPEQGVGVWLRTGANNNAVVRNILFKNVKPIINDSIGNWIADNVVVPR